MKGGEGRCCAGGKGRKGSGKPREAWGEGEKMEYKFTLILLLLLPLLLALLPPLSLPPPIKIIIIILIIIMI